MNESLKRFLTSVVNLASASEPAALMVKNAALKDANLAGMRQGGVKSDGRVFVWK